MSETVDHSAPSRAEMVFWCKYCRHNVRLHCVLRGFELTVHSPACLEFSPRKSDGHLTAESRKANIE